MSPTSRMPLTLSDNSLKIPFAPTSEQERVAQSRYAEWTKSDYAGFRRVLTAGSPEEPDLSLLTKTAAAYRTGASGRKLSHFVVLGTGGSSLGGEALIRALLPAGDQQRFLFLDNNEPDYFYQHLRALPLEETLWYVVSKSGKTPETLSQLLAVLEAYAPLGPDAWKKHVVLCSDPKSGDLREFARRHGATCLDVPSAVGGRFSVLTPVGLFPAVWAGVSANDLLLGARALVDAWEGSPLQENPSFQLAWQLVSDAQRPITILMPYSTRLAPFSRWFCQLWAESLGKNGKGLTPYPAIGTTDQHSQMQLYMEGPRDKSVVLLKLRHFDENPRLSAHGIAQGLPAFQELEGKSMRELFDAEFAATRDAMTKQGVAVVSMEIDRLDAYSLGALFFFWEWATLWAGAILGVNPFDQPGVEAAKVLTKKYLAESRG